MSNGIYRRTSIETPNEIYRRTLDEIPIATSDEIFGRTSGETLDW